MKLLFVTVVAFIAGCVTIQEDTIRVELTTKPDTNGQYAVSIKRNSITSHGIIYKSSSPENGEFKIMRLIDLTGGERKALIMNSI